MYTTRAPDRCAARSMIAKVLLNEGWKNLVSSTDSILTMLGVGFALQIALGALSYLIPVILGGGPQVIRINIDHSSRFFHLRISSLNLGLLFLIISESNFSQSIGIGLVSISVLINLLICVKQFLIYSAIQKAKTLNKSVRFQLPFRPPSFSIKRISVIEAEGSKDLTISIIVSAAILTAVEKPKVFCI